MSVLKLSYKWELLNAMDPRSVKLQYAGKVEAQF